MPQILLLRLVMAFSRRTGYSPLLIMSVGAVVLVAAIATISAVTRPV